MNSPNTTNPANPGDPPEIPDWLKDQIKLVKEKSCANALEWQQICDDLTQACEDLGIEC